MFFVRTVHITRYKAKRKRFEECFNAIGGGISVFQYQCAKRQSKSICLHIRDYYKSTVNVPILYCVFDANEIINFTKQISNGAIVSIEQTDGGNKDPCHYDILNVPAKTAEKFTFLTC